MISIKPSEHLDARELFSAAEHHLLISALFENNLKAQLYVDDISEPRAGLIGYNGRFIFGGDPSQSAFNANLRHYFSKTAIPARNGEDFLATFTSEEWIPALDAIFEGCKTILAPRLYFETTPKPVSDLTLPAGFSPRPVSKELLGSDIGGLDALREEMRSERASVEDFLENSFGLCPIYENRIAGWCLSEYNTGARCEIGIATLEPHQRQGVATALTKAFLAESFKRGYGKVGWDCWEKNVASASTARKAGFDLIKREQAMIVILDR